jgi:MFS family permease
MLSDRSADPDSAYSWVVAITGAVAMVFTFATPISYGIFREPFSETFGASPLALSVVFALMLFSFSVGSGIVGVFGVRFSARRILLICTLATAAIAPALYVTSSVIGLTVVLMILGISLGTVFVLIAGIVPRWFKKRRGAATGLIFVGNGLGLLLVPPLWQFVLSEFGVRPGFLIVMSVTAISFLFTALICRRPPWVEQSGATTDEILAWLARLGGTRSFRLLFVGIALAFAWYPLLAAYAVDLFSVRGLTETTASTAFGLIGGVSIISRIGAGYISDIVGPRRAMLASLLCVSAGISLLFVPTIPVLAVAICLIGLGLGGTATLFLPLIMSVYSTDKDTAIVGVFNFSGGIAILAMPPLGTASVSYTGGFTTVIIITLSMTILGTLLIATGTAN